MSLLSLLLLLGGGAADPTLASDLLRAEARWQAFAPELFRYLDRDGDGHLSPEEFGRAPSPGQVRSQGSAGLYPRYGLAGAELSRADLNGDGRVSLMELRAYYQQGGAGPVAVSWVDPPASSIALTQAIRMLIDRDGDGALSADEQKAARESLGRADRNQDDLLTPAELTGQAEHGAPTRPVGLERYPTQPRLAVGIAAVFRQRFAEADRQAQGRIRMGDLAGSEHVALRDLFPLADRDGDGWLTAEELDRCVSLHTRWLGVPVVFTLSGGTAGWFESLDTNQDGRLSLRELRDLEAVLNQEALPAVRVGWSVGPPGPANTMSEPVTRTDAPRWFLLLDRNGDGDISPREFTGPVEDFRRLDLDGDGLIHWSEAVRGR